MTTRKISIDLVKTAAIFGVIVIHCGGNCLYGDVRTARFALTVIIESAVRGSVPLFFMCSGALFLGLCKPIGIKRLYVHSIPRLVAAMLFWAMLYKLTELPALTVPAILRGIKDVLLFRQEFHLYFIHILLLVYALVPVTRAFLRGAKRRDILYFLLLWFLLGIVYPTVSRFWPFSELSGIPAQWRLNMTWAAVGYGVLGIFLWENRPPRPASALLFLAGFLFTLLATLISSRRSGQFVSAYFEGMTVGPCLMAAGFFGFCLDVRLGEQAEKLCRRVSDASFCVYLVHILFLKIMQKLFGIISSPLLIFPLSAAVFALSMGVWFLLSKVPVVNRWIV